ncbi:esterase family protein [Brucepastera parasyntrophica]|uniref:alpha/beta hydrolase n=1 Tax=Brucepastera parasyntrophica TaxID=2880008 RepID=UPI002108DE8B|nr:alpha/beta hydrolase-fold protein [Brucepastera parasyntrophica]ULQ59524.1 esterase family protein [Brucepastera parasyntrophica]
MKQKLYVIMAVSLALFLGCTSAPDKQVRQENPESRLERWAYDFTSLKSNRIGDRSIKNVKVYLPPSYYTSDKSYPVVYFLHGYNEVPGELVRSLEFADEAFSGQDAKEMIIVEPEGSNLYRGSFYVNSPATGNYEDYIAKELVALIDSKYRTIAKKEARGIAGFSMGGFGTLNLALKHPDVFSCVQALGPGVFPNSELTPAIMRTWDSGFLTAYGIVFSPDMTGEKPKAEIPVLDGSEIDNEILARWNKGFGDWDKKIDDYKSGGISLKAIMIMYGTRDYYPWIREGSEYLHKLLDSYGTENTLKTFEGGHLIPHTFLKEDFVPFFSRNLSIN